jgi:hypothetical protein
MPLRGARASVGRVQQVVPGKYAEILWVINGDHDFPHYNMFEGMPYFQIPKGSKCSVSPRDLSCHKMYGMHWYAKYVYRMHPTPGMDRAKWHRCFWPGTIQPGSRSFAWLFVDFSCSFDGSFALFGEMAKSRVP